MIVDTDFLIDVMKGEKNAVDRQQKLKVGREIYRVSAPTVFELWTGIMLSKKPESEKEKVLSILTDIDTVKLNRQSAEKAGEIHGGLIKSGQEIDAIDSMIVGIALLENEPVLTGNIKHFGRVKGLRVESYKT